MPDSEFHATSITDLDALTAFVLDACTQAGANQDVCFDVRLAVEEVFTNIIEHGYPAHQGPVVVKITPVVHGIRIEARDWAPPFDPTSTPVDGVGPDWENRSPGGLGLHLVRTIMDTVAYGRDAAGSNVLTLIKNFPAATHGAGTGNGNMQIEFVLDGDVSVVSITGSVDSLTAESLMAKLGEHVGAGHSRLVVDMGGCEYTSSAGLRALLSTLKATRSGGGDLRLACVNHNVLKVLDLSGFTTIMKLFDEVDQAIASYSASAAP